MKNRLFPVIVIFALAIMLAGCQKAEDSQFGNSSQTSNAVSSESSVADAVSGIHNSGKIDGYLESFEQLIAEEDLKLQGKTTKDAASIGASDGYGYSIGGIPFEIYLFDPSNTGEQTQANLKTAKESGYITIFGVEINGKTLKSSCTLNGNLVLIFPTEDMLGKHPNKQAIVEAFMNIG